MQTTTAIFEDGFLKPTQPLDLPEHAEVRITVEALERQDRATMPINRNGASDREPPVADFMEPVDYAWTEAGFEARLALKTYSEQTHADH